MPPAAIRRFVFERAFFLCEYCLLHESDSYLPHQIEYVISQKHKGGHDIENLACACFFCNRLKGTDLSTVLLPDLEIVGCSVRELINGSTISICPAA